MIVEVVRGSGPAVRRANPVREPGRFTGRATTDKETALPQAHRAHGPSSRERTPTAPTGDGRGPPKRGAAHGDHQERPQQDRAHVGPPGLAHALAHAVEPDGSSMPSMWAPGHRAGR